ncbi:hypothetical protein C0989_011565 [Termitomyces sp. Mn162]|nr:hypothetical protein C0989_011565 [Termitomyces sp. Mn162]
MMDLEKVPAPTPKLPPVIPPDHDHRTLVLCFDGTGDQFDSDNSNIVELVSLLKKNDPHKQMVYYQAGIGTYVFPQIATPLTAKVSKILDEMFAWNLNHHVMGGYEFLMQNSRSLAGMVHKVGLLPADNHQQVPFAYKMYTRTDPIGWEQSNSFKLAFASSVPIEFIGVWDTVDSVGLIPKRLPFTASNKSVKTFRHAIALDERRAKFKANFWNRPNDHEQTLGVHTIRVPTPDPDNEKYHNEYHHDVQRRTKVSADRILDRYERLYSTDGNHVETDVEEVWFAGCHCGMSLCLRMNDNHYEPTSPDVGGGSVANKTRHSLARIPLRWMVRECFKANTGIMFDTDALRTIGLDPATLYPIVLPRSPQRLDASTELMEKLTRHGLLKRLRAYWNRKANAAPSVIITTNNHTVIDEELEDLKDALSPIYDQLQLKWGWWILEILPLHLRYQRGNNKWVSKFTPNRADPRIIPKQRDNGVKVHRTVQLRMQARPAPGHKSQYKPRAKFIVEPTWID